MTESRLCCASGPVGPCPTHTELLSVMGSFQLEDFVAGWIGGECACERPPPPTPAPQGKLPGGTEPAIRTQCAQCALHCEFHHPSRSERRLQHRVSLAQSAWLVLRSLLICEAKLFKSHIDFLELLICLNLGSNVTWVP